MPGRDGRRVPGPDPREDADGGREEFEMANPTKTDARRRRYPEGRVIGALAPTVVESVTVAVTTAKIPADQIDVITAADTEGPLTPLNRAGVAGFAGRFLLSLGDDLDELERAGQELAFGHVIVTVPVEGEDELHRVYAVLRDHGGHALTHFGRWTITSLG